MDARKQTIALRPLAVVFISRARYTPGDDHLTYLARDRTVLDDSDELRTQMAAGFGFTRWLERLDVPTND